jgi:hypothetical protein
MRANVLRDEPVLPILTQLLQGYRAYFGAAVEELMRGRRLRGAAAVRTRAAIGHALSFGTWQSLVRDQGLGDADAVELMCALVAGAGEKLSVP